MEQGGSENRSRGKAGEAVLRQRLDLWIWHARFLRTRQACANLIKSGFVRVNGMRVTQPGHAVKIGDVLTLALPGTTRVVMVLAFSDERGDAGRAATLFSAAEIRETGDRKV